MIGKNFIAKKMKDEEFLNALKISISANLGWGFELFDLVVYLYVTTTIAPLFFPSSSYKSIYQKVTEFKMWMNSWNC